MNSVINDAGKVLGGIKLKSNEIECKEKVV